jgi:hypothetical protein
VQSLWEARSFLLSLGYSWGHDGKGRTVWSRLPASGKE